MPFSSTTNILTITLVNLLLLPLLSQVHYYTWFQGFIRLYEYMSSTDMPTVIYKMLLYSHENIREIFCRRRQICFPKVSLLNHTDLNLRVDTSMFYIIFENLAKPLWVNSEPLGAATHNWINHDVAKNLTFRLCFNYFNVTSIIIPSLKILRGYSSLANYTDQATAACQWS
jgi:hypothetical protein